jgi:hypothetical protein
VGGSLPVFFILMARNTGRAANSYRGRGRAAGNFYGHRFAAQLLG